MSSDLLTGRLARLAPTVALCWLLLAVPGAARASLSWSGPIGVDPGHVLIDVACPSSSQCTALDYEGGEATFDPASPTGATRKSVATGLAMTALSCPTTGS